MPAKVLFNCTTNTAGGGVKNSLLYIRHNIDSTNPWETHYAISSQVCAELKACNVTLGSNFHVFESSPARDFGSRRRLLRLSQELKVDFVYTMAGPAYVKFQVPHLMGISNPYITHAQVKDIIAIDKNLFRAVKHLIEIRLRLIQAKRADWFLFQTEHSRERFLSRSNYDKSKTYVVPNAYTPTTGRIVNQTTPGFPGKDITILCVGAAFRHKNWCSVPQLAQRLNRDFPAYRFKFVFTLKGDSSDWNKLLSEFQQLGLSDTVSNFGEFNYSQIDNLYDQADIALQPSLLETFSATYLEAFQHGIPLVVLDRLFSRSICGDAAFFYSDLKSFSDAIRQIVNNADVRNSKLSEGYRLLKRFPTQAERINAINSIIAVLSRSTQTLTGNR